MKLQKTIRALSPAAEKATALFQLLFFVYVCLGFNNLTVGTKIVSVFMWPTYLLGAAILAFRALDAKRYLRMPGLPALVLLCGAAAVSVALNRRYDLKGNLVCLIFWLFYFFLLYLSGAETGIETLKKRFALYFHLFCGVAFVLTAVSFVMLAKNYALISDVNGELVRRGFLGGRLFGAYQTPNAGAIIASIVIAGCVHYIRAYKKWYYTVVAAIQIALQFAFIVFSDSRTGRVCLGLGLGVYLFFACLRNARGETRAARTLLCAALAAAVTVSGFFLPKWTQLAYNAAVMHAGSGAGNAEEAEEEKDGTASDPKKEEDPFLLGRKESLENDYSNRRFDFWKSGLEIFLSKPVFGVTFKGFLPYAEENMPDTYLVSNSYRALNTFDNDIVNLAVSCGIAGLLPFAAFVAVVLMRLVRLLRRRERPDPISPLLLAVCAAAAASSLFSSGVLYMQCQYSFLFWLALGLLMRLTPDAAKKAKADRPAK